MDIALDMLKHFLIFLTYLFIGSFIGMGFDEWPSTDGMAAGTVIGGIVWWLRRDK